MKFKRFWNWRFPVAGALAALALVVGVTIFLPQKHHESVLVVRTPICAGCEVTAKDVRVSDLDRGALPNDYFDSPKDIEGRKAAVTLEPGMILSPNLLLENSLNDLRTGEVAFALSIDDPAVAGFSQTGQTVEIWSSDSQTENQLLATGVRVLGVEASKDSLLGTSQSKAIVYLAAAEDSARKVVAAKDEHSLSFVLRG